MTKVSLGPDELDQLALRLFDVGAAVRGMARECREKNVPTVELHVGKAQEWIARLDEWLAKSQAELQQTMIRERGRRAAQAKS